MNIPPVPRGFLMLLAFLSLVISAKAQSPYAGDYLGNFFINGIGGGKVFITIDAGGNLSEQSGELSGTVASNGEITYGANDFGFTNSTIDGNFSFIATGSADTLNYRMEAFKSAGVFSSDTLDDVFTQTNPLNFFSGGVDVLWDGAQYVALTGQSIAISPDGLTWQTRSIGLTATFTRIAFGNGTYVVVGDGNTVASSTDLETWTLRSSGIPGFVQQNFADVAFFNNRFWALNIVKNYISSADGVAWTQETPFVTSGFGGFGRLESLNGSLVAAYKDPASSANTVFYISANGQAFSGPSAAVNIGSEPKALAFGGGVYLASSNGGIARSTNGTTWTKVDALPSTSATALSFSGGKFSGRFLNGKFYTSADGLTWAEAPGATGNAEAMASSGSTVVAVGGEPFHSTDSGSNWNQTSSNGLGGLFAYGIVAGNGIFVLHADGANAYRTTDGENFADVGFRLDGVAFGNGVFAGYDRTAKVIRYSVDGIEWYQATVIPGHNVVSFGAIAFSGELFYKNGLVSADGITWDWAEGVTSVKTEARRGGGGELVNYGSGPTYNISLDGGKTFQNQNNGSAQAYGAAFGSGIWTMGFSSGYYRYGSSLGALAGGRYSEGAQTPGIRSMNFLGGVFYGSLEDNRVIVSTDGTSWVPKSLGANVSLIGAAQSGPLGLLSGSGGSVFKVELGGSFAIPSISDQPDSVGANEGDNVILTATVDNASGASYRWIRDGVPLDDVNLSGEDTATLTVTGIRADQAGGYRLLILGPDGGAISDVASVTVAPLAVFTTQPQSVTVSENGNVIFTAAVDDVTATFQWRKNGMNMDGEMGSTLTLSGIGSSDAAIYTVVATNAVGPRESLPAGLSVNSGGGTRLKTSFMANVPVYNASFDSMSAVAQQGDRLVVGGFFTITSSPRQSNLMRLNADGTFDNTFSLNLINGNVDAIGVDSQGRFYAGGPFTFPNGILVTSANGAELGVFNIASGPTVFDFLSYGTNMTVAGNFLQFNNDAANAGVARVDGTNQSHDQAFTSRINTAIAPSFVTTSAAMQSDGKLLLAGAQRKNGTNATTITMKRFNVDGTLDGTFQQPVLTGTNASFREIVVDEDDSIFALGFGTAINGQAPASSRFFKFGKDGAPDLTFASALAGDANTYIEMAYVGNRTLVAAYQKSIALSTEDGSVVPIDFGAGPKRAGGVNDGEIYGIQRVTDGFILTGKFATFDGQPTNGIAYYVTGSGGVSLPLSIVKEPVSVTERLGQRTRFVVAATGSGLRYEWTRHGVVIEGETSNQLEFPVLEPGNAGSYQVTVFDGEDNSVTSAEVEMVIPGIDPPTITFQEWAQANLPGGEFSVDGDANGNGQADGLDFVFGSGARPGDFLPTSGLRTGSELGIGGPEKYLTFSVRRRIGVAGLNLSPVASTKLSDLSSGASNVVPMASDPDGEFEIIHYRTTFSIDAAGRAFFQIRVIED